LNYKELFALLTNNMTTPAVLYDHVPMNRKDLGMIHESNWEALSPAEDAHMETIMEDYSADYVMVYSNSNMPQEEEEPQLQFIWEENDEFVFVEAPTTSSKWWRLLTQYAEQAARQTYEWTTQGLSRSAAAAAAAAAASTRRPNSRTIYSSYDWVSDTVIDESGGRLILPGQLITMDGSSSVDSSMQDLAQAKNSGSFTIMVSAHDLLATRTTPASSADKDELSTILRATTASLPKALWGIAKRKTSRWAFYAHRKLFRSTEGVILSAGSYLTQWGRSTDVVSATSEFVFGCLDRWLPSEPEDGEEQEPEDDTCAPEQVTIELTTNSSGEDTVQQSKK
jgi:hypothetical protein